MISIIINNDKSADITDIFCESKKQANHQFCTKCMIIESSQYKKTQQVRRKKGVLVVPHCYILWEWEIFNAIFLFPYFILNSFLD